MGAPRKPTARERALQRRLEREGGAPEKSENVVPLHDRTHGDARFGKRPACEDHKKVDQRAPCPTCGRCHATSSQTGRPCKKSPILGGGVCLTHGGSAAQVQKAARLRLLALADPAISALSAIVQDEEAADGDRLRAATAILDRTGFGPGSKVEVEDRKWQGVVGKVIRPTGERTRSRYADRHYEQDD